MSLEAYRWLMTAVNAPLERAAFRAEPGPGEVAIAVAGCGVCHTDLGYLYDGVRTNQPLPLALGHEISGRVVEAGAGAESWLGKAAIVPAVITPLPPLPASAMEILDLTPRPGLFAAARVSALSTVECNSFLRPVSCFV